jgi:hypothetical protein
MCCIPCFPYSDVDFEEEPRARKRASEAYQYVWNGQNWVLQPYNGRSRRSVSIQITSFSSVFPMVLSKVGRIPSALCSLP